MFVKHKSLCWNYIYNSIITNNNTVRLTLTTQEKALSNAFSLVVTSPSKGPKCIPTGTVWPWLKTPSPALEMLDRPITKPCGNVSRVLWGMPIAVGESHVNKGGPWTSHWSMKCWWHISQSAKKPKSKTRRGYCRHRKCKKYTWKGERKKI